MFIVLNVSLQVGSYKDITEESVSLFHMLEPRIGNSQSTLTQIGENISRKNNSFHNYVMFLMMVVKKNHPKSSLL